MRPLFALIASAAVLVAAGCGDSGSRGGATAAGDRTSATRDAASSAAIGAALDAVFERPTAAQCRTAMTRAYVKQTFGAFTSGERKVAGSARRVCAIHQRQRAAMDAELRAVTIHDLAVQGDTATAALRGANGYPIAVRLTRAGARWLLDGEPTPGHESGRGHQVAPDGSLYAYRVPPGFVVARASVGPVDVTGSAYATAVGSPAARREHEGVAVAQSTSASFFVHDAADLRAQMPAFERHLREGLRTLTGQSVAGFATSEISGRPALSWTVADERVLRRTTFVFTSAPPVVVAVNCVWARSTRERRIVEQGCDALLRSLQVS